MKRILYMISIIVGSIAISSLIIATSISEMKKNKNVSAVSDVETNTIIDEQKIKKVDGEIKIRLLRNATNSVEEMNLEDYVLGVVSAEMPAEFPEEAIKAQAVAARTYALAHVEEFGGTSYSKEKNANLIDTVANQVYYSKDQRFAGWPENKQEGYWSKITEAVNATKGEVLTYNDRLVLSPYFFSTSWGKTEDAVSVFNHQEPYLTSVDSPGEEDSPKYTYSIEKNNNEIISAINANYSNCLNSTESLKTQIKILERDSADGVSKIKVGNQTLTGVEVRKLLKLNSTNFQIEFKDNTTVFNTKGYGHNVGMSQWGARAMAKAGSGYIDILKHYYTGVEIFNMYK